MSRRPTTLAALAAGGLALLAAAPVASAAHHGKRPGVVRGLTVHPRGSKSVVLEWRRAKRGSRPLAGYRVLRNGKTVRQTRARRMRVPVWTTRTWRYRVVAVDTAGRLGPRSVAVVVKAGHKRPTPPRAVAVSNVTATTATLSWAPARAIRSRIASYRVIDPSGRTVHGAHGTSLRLSGLASAHTRTYRVLAVDSLGWTSAPSAAVTVTTGHTAPPAPAAPVAATVSDTSLTLMWAPVSVPAGTKLRGYRVLRDGVVVAQVPGPKAVIANLAPKSVHDWSVAAVDTLGYSSPASRGTRVLQADPPPSRGNAHAFLLASTDASFAAFQRHYRQVGVVYPTFFDCNTATGGIEGANDPLIVSYARDRKVKVLPRFNCQDTATDHRILTNPTLREQWLDDMVSMAERYGYDGVNVDLEATPADDRGAMTSFIAALAARLHARGKLLSQAVSAKTHDILDHPRSGAFDYPALTNYDDYIFVMAWGIHWTTSSPGPQEDLTWVTQIVQYLDTMPREGRFVLGTNLYAMDWPAGGGASHPATARHYMEVQQLIARYGVKPAYESATDSLHLRYTDGSGVGHDVYYPDATTIGHRLALARSHGLGIGFWRIGQEDERMWSNPLLPGA
jgi:spore germination protein YaaH